MLLAIMGLLAAALPAVSPSATPTLLPSELRPGDHAVVRTVFQGDSIETFDAEILGVLRTGRLDGETIVARATSERVIRLGIAQGMSGSPVYVNGRLIGALSSGWSFAREPLFGITPIQEMLHVLDLPASSDTSGAGAGPSGIEEPGTARPPRFRELRWDDAEPDDPAPAARAPGAGPQALALPVACAGLNPAALGPLARSLEPLGLAAVPGGRATPRPGHVPRLEPGSAVAVDLMRGDLELSAIGTLTWRDGDRVLIFGHPFFQSGAVRMPLSTAEIATVVGSQAMSFKLGVRGEAAGVVTQDRRAAVAGRLGGSVRMMPLRVTVKGVAREPVTYRFEALEDRAIAPTLVGTAAMNSVLENGGTGGGQTVRWSMTLYRRGAAPLRLEDLIASDSPVTDLLAATTQPLHFLLGNPFSRVSLDSVTVAVEVQPVREQWTLRSARVLDAAVRPGGRVHVRCEVERWRGDRELRDLELTVPEETPDGRTTLWIGGGAELTRFEAREQPGRYRVVSVEDAWERLSRTRASDALYAALYLDSPDLTSDGLDYPELPISALALMAGGQGAGDRVRRGDVAKLDEERLALQGLVRGELQLRVMVDSKAP